MVRMMDIWLETASSTSGGSVESKSASRNVRVRAVRSGRRSRVSVGRRPGVRPLGGEPVGHAAADDALARQGLERPPVVHQAREVPGEHDGQLDRLPRPDPCAEPERARVRLPGRARRSLRAVRQPAVGPEVVPEILDVVEPAAPLPVLGERDVAPGRGDRDGARAGMRGIEAGPAHAEAADSVPRPSTGSGCRRTWRAVGRAARTVTPSKPDRIHLRVGERNVHRAAGGVPQAPEEDGDGQAGHAVVERHERGERLELRLDGQASSRGTGRSRWDTSRRRSLPRDAGAREAAQGDRPRSPTKGGRRRRSRIRATGVPAVRPRPDREEAEGQVTPLGRAVEDLPVAQLAAAAERDRPGPDAPERERDLLERGAGEAAGARGGAGTGQRCQA